MHTDITMVLTPENYHQFGREQRGIRGPVKICIEEVTYPVSAAADGSLTPERKYQHTTEYDSEGRTLARRSNRPNDSDWVNRYTWNASGLLVKETWGKEGDPPSESIYLYDDQGRLQSITYSDKPDNPVTFHYDEHGRKTKWQVSHPEDYRPNVAGSGDSPFWSADRPPNMEGGGTAITIYDEHNRPTEVRIHDSQGELVGRAIRTYDAQGRIAEEKLVHDDIVTILSAATRARILETPGASLDDLRQQLTKLMSGQSGPSSIAFAYDPQGRIIQKTRRVFNTVDQIEITYNEQGDKAVKFTRTEQVDSPEQYSESHYEYQYDSHGNWTEKLDSWCSMPGATCVPSTKTHRKFTYF
jgi:YD repeat-containing protein